MKVEIRECRLSDCNDIYELNKNEMGYDYPCEDTYKKLMKLIKSESDKIFVAVSDNKTIGYIHINDYESVYAPPMKNIMGIAVAEKYKRQGIGRKLMNEAENWAKNTGAYAIRLVSGAERKGAHEFYYSCGFEKTKEQLNLKKKLHQDPQ